MTEVTIRSVDRVNRLLLTIAAAWSALLALGGSFLVPAYSSSSVSSSSVGPAGSRVTRTIVTSSQTLLQANGLRVLVLLALPLLAVGVVAFSLRKRWVTGRPGPGVLAWTVSGFVGIVSLLGILTIGIVVLPVAVLLLVVCARST